MIKDFVLQASLTNTTIYYQLQNKTYSFSYQIPLPIWNDDGIPLGSTDKEAGYNEIKNRYVSIIDHIANIQKNPDSARSDNDELYFIDGDGGLQWFGFDHNKKQFCFVDDYDDRELHYLTDDDVSLFIQYLNAVISICTRMYHDSMGTIQQLKKK